MTTTVGPGLDVDALRSLRQSPRDLELLHRRISEHLAEHDGYLAFSGGKDSLVVLHLARAVEPNIPVAFFDSGLEFPETYRYLDDLQHRWRLNLDVIPARPTALDVLAASGAWDHAAPAPATPAPDLRDVLITGPSNRAHRQHGPGELWGVRAAESQGRAALYARALRRETARICRSCCPTTRARGANHGGTIRRLDGTTAYSPIWDWPTTEVWAHISRHQLPLNPVYATLRHLGAPDHALRLSQMLTGAHLETGRATWLRRGWPDLFEDLCTVLPRLREYI